jgi:predicted ATP-binding protein involved in virulence
MNRIDRLILHNYRLFDHLELAFPAQFTVLIGGNGRGKTSILDGLTVAIGAFLLGFDNIGQIQSIERDDVRRVARGPMSVEPQLPCSVEAWSGAGKQALHWWREISRLSKKTTASFKYSKQVIDIAEEYQKMVRQGEEIQLPVFAYHGTGRLWAEHSQKLKYSATGSRIEQGYHTCLSPKSATYEFLSWYKTYQDEVTKFDRVVEKDLLQAFNEAIAAMVPRWKDVTFSHAEDDLMGTFEDVDGQKQYMPYRLLSDGYRNIIGMAADIAYRCIKLNPHLGLNAVKEAKGIVLIDEIDLHLHPEWQKTVVADLKRAFPNLQFIATTHSPFIVQSLSNEELIDLTGKDMDSDYFRKSIEEIAAGEMGVTNVQRSQKFLDWQNAAEEYFGLLELNGSANPQELAARKARLDELELLYNEDPAWVALLKAERKSKAL